jgi:hypothetical protein
VFAALAVFAVVALRWLDGAAAWVGWGGFALFGWAAVMSVYSFDRPAPAVRSTRAVGIGSGTRNKPEGKAERSEA